MKIKPYFLRDLKNIHKIMATVGQRNLLTNKHILSIKMTIRTDLISSL